jgi:hypothetical protein
MAAPSVTIFGPIDTIVGPYIEWIVLGLVLVNLVTRKRASDVYRRRAANGDDDFDRNRAHVFTTWGLLLMSFYYLTLHHHAGLVMSSLVLGLFLTDFFEFEARKVEAREALKPELPKSSLAMSVLVVMYAAYQTLFFVIAPYWNAVV